MHEPDLICFKQVDNSIYNFAKADEFSKNVSYCYGQSSLLGHFTRLLVSPRGIGGNPCLGTSETPRVYHTMLLFLRFVQLINLLQEFAIKVPFKKGKEVRGGSPDLCSLLSLSSRTCL